MLINEFAERLGEDFSPGDIRLVLGVFSGDLERLTGELARLAGSGQVKPFRDACHALAGACGTVGAVVLERICRVAMVRDDLAPEGLAGALEPLLRVAEETRAEMQTYLATLPSAPSLG
jgi:HPt (histidine-containing phosphotransfer) domain-containing protein